MLKNLDKSIESYLLTRYNNDNTNLKYIITRIHLHIDENDILCPICGNERKFVGINYFLKTCGNVECSKKLNFINRSATNIERYGVSVPAKNE